MPHRTAADHAPQRTRPSRSGCKPWRLAGWVDDVGELGQHDARMFNRLTFLVVLAIFCASCQHPGAYSDRSPITRNDDTEVVTLSLSQFEQVLYFFQATRGEIRRTPEWRQDSAFPPLSPRLAETAALLEAGRLRPDVQKWHRESISLQETWDGRWMYVVRLWRGDVAYTGLPPFLDVPVLMDGHAIEGATKERKG
jgi:hypothetical protein